MAATPHDTDAGTVLLVISLLLTVFVLVTTILRVLVRLQRLLLSWDDYLIAAAAGLVVGRTIIQVVSVTRGNGKHHWQLSDNDYEYVNLCGWLTQLFLFPLLALLKSSICLLVLRIKDQRWLRYFLWGTIIGLILTNLLPEIILLAECSPVDAYWKGESAKCWNPKVRIYSIYLQTAYSVTTDLLCSLLPIYVVWDLQMSTAKKVGIWCLMSLGLVSTAFALLRASTLGLVTSDLSFEYCWTAIWADIEAYLGIIAANLSLSRMYYGWLKDKFRGDSGARETAPGSVEAGSCPLSPYSCPKSSDSEQIRGRRVRRDSDTPSEESQILWEFCARFDATEQMGSSKWTMMNVSLTLMDRARDMAEERPCPYLLCYLLWIEGEARRFTAIPDCPIWSTSEDDRYHARHVTRTNLPRSSKSA